MDAGPVAAQGGDDRAVGVDHLGSLAITLFRAGGDGFARGFGRQGRGYAVRRQGLRDRDRTAHRDARQRRPNPDIE